MRRQMVTTMYNKLLKLDPRLYLVTNHINSMGKNNRNSSDDTLYLQLKQFLASLSSFLKTLLNGHDLYLTKIPFLFI